MRQDETLGLFGKRLQRKKYQLFVREGIDKELDNYFKQIRRLPILGSETFIKTVSEKYLRNKHVSNEIPEHKIINKITSNEIMDRIAEHFETSVADLKVVNRRGDNWPRAVAMYLTTELTQETLQTIANTFTNITYSGISKNKSRVMAAMKEQGSIAKEIGRLVKVLVSQ